MVALFQNSKFRKLEKDIGYHIGFFSGNAFNQVKPVSSKQLQREILRAFSWFCGNTTDPCKVCNDVSINRICSAKTDKRFSVVAYHFRIERMNIYIVRNEFFIGRQEVGYMQTIEGC